MSRNSRREDFAGDAYPRNLGLDAYRYSRGQTMTFHFYPSQDRTREARRESLRNLSSRSQESSTNRAGQISIRRHAHSGRPRNTARTSVSLCDALVLRLSPAGPAFLPRHNDQSNDEIFEIFPGNERTS